MKMKVALDPGATMPTRSYKPDGGLDLYAMQDVWMRPCSREIFDTGVHAAIPRGCAGLVKSRSGMTVNNGCTTDGVIDSGYTGSIHVPLFNHSRKDVYIKRGDRIAQLLIIPILTPELEQVDKLEDTERGMGGFGSTGK